MRYEDIPAKIKDNEVDVFAWRPPGRRPAWPAHVHVPVRYWQCQAPMEEDPRSDHLYQGKSVDLWFDRLRLAVLIGESELNDLLHAAMITCIEGLIFPASDAQAPDLANSAWPIKL